MGNLGKIVTLVTLGLGAQIASREKEGVSFFRIFIQSPHTSSGTIYQKALKTPKSTKENICKVMSL